MAKASSQKFIARNRAPRVQIEYDVETYGSEKKVQLPFVVGVMSDLSGKPTEPLPRGRRPQDARDRRRQFRRAHEVDEAARRVHGAEHPDRRRQPRGRHHLREHGRFLARRRSRRRSTASTSCSRRARSLSNLLTYMDGKTGAEDLIAKVLQDPALLQTLASRAEAGTIPTPSGEE